jgi:hypothetical protein
MSRDHVSPSEVRDFMAEIEAVKRMQSFHAARELAERGASAGLINDILWEAGDELCHPMSDGELERWATHNLALLSGGR